MNKTANGKAYEMLSNLVGVCELARATGDREPAGARAERLERHRREPTLHHRQRQRGRAFPGRSRAAESGRRKHLRDVRHDHVDPAQFAASPAHGRCQVRRRARAIVLQSPGRRPAPARRRLVLLHGARGQQALRSGINCCHSSGPRGMALAVQAAYLKLERRERRLWS